ncbi:DNA-binding transcriptional regulator UME6 KNAG_0A04550 [Huiozyma naganishii CBS 8797]|uniref:Zn(2)-C6 fungal-type domain-containing protein n=1 Tax=Huiozyma naganishii (strain ATCC MYA-139 / BCRC 22969 / CBS 8797 / KCTC 17520 / NBRC 10181 / NCYC 3082 / Yp74L-3) TaxID=1071383 RepID=J7RTP7_HUIN7|nr:hypothetical protein KNAG_0A04550 [Kazachstania naganishii CBS 8797]CCK68127.1 hypothetical protein KNAG_0A04550 [Kazachstania naganishii CBS 8797]
MNNLPDTKGAPGNSRRRSTLRHSGLKVSSSVRPMDRDRQGRTLQNVHTPAGSRTKNTNVPHRSVVEHTSNDKWLSPPLTNHEEPRSRATVAPNNTPVVSRIASPLGAALGTPAAMLHRGVPKDTVQQAPPTSPDFTHYTSDPRATTEGATHRLTAQSQNVTSDENFTVRKNPLQKEEKTKYGISNFLPPVLKFHNNNNNNNSNSNNNSSSSGIILPPPVSTNRGNIATDFSAVPSLGSIYGTRNIDRSMTFDDKLKDSIPYTGRERFGEDAMLNATALLTDTMDREKNSSYALPSLNRRRNTFSESNSRTPSAHIRNTPVQETGNFKNGMLDMDSKLNLEPNGDMAEKMGLWSAGRLSELAFQRSNDRGGSSIMTEDANINSPEITTEPITLRQLSLHNLGRPTSSGRQENPTIDPLTLASSSWRANMAQRQYQNMEDRDLTSRFRTPSIHTIHILPKVLDTKMDGLKHRMLSAPSKDAHMGHSQPLRQDFQLHGRTSDSDLDTAAVALSALRSSPFKFPDRRSSLSSIPCQSAGNIALSTQGSAFSRPHSSSFSSVLRGPQQRPILRIHQREAPTSSNSGVNHNTYNAFSDTSDEDSSRAGKASFNMIPPSERNVTWNKNGKRVDKDTLPEMESVKRRRGRRKRKTSVSTTYAESESSEVSEDELEWRESDDASAKVSEADDMADPDAFVVKQKRGRPRNSDSKRAILEREQSTGKRRVGRPLGSKSKKNKGTPPKVKPVKREKKGPKPDKPNTKFVKDGGSASSSTGTRSRTGCWICRLRKKKCTEEKPNCRNCVRLNLECFYDVMRPDFVADPAKKQMKLEEIKIHTREAKRAALKRRNGPQGNHPTDHDDTKIKTDDVDGKTPSEINEHHNSGVPNTNPIIT